MQPWEWHPALVHFPLAFLISAAVVDAWRGVRGRSGASPVAAGLLLAGVLTGVVAAGFGIVAFYTVPAHTTDAHVRMYWHLRLGVVALLVAAPIAVVRWRARHMPPAGWMRAGTLVVALLVGITGYLGGQLILRGGAGVDPALLAEELRGGHSHAEVAAAGVAPGVAPATGVGPVRAPAPEHYSAPTPTRPHDHGHPENGAAHSH